MRRLATTLLLVVAWAALEAQPALAQKKDTLLLMRQLDTMQQMIMNMQKTLDTQTAVLKTLVEQTNDNVSAMKVQMEELRKVTQQNLASSSARADSSSACRGRWPRGRCTRRSGRGCRSSTRWG